MLDPLFQGVGNTVRNVRTVATSNITTDTFFSIDTGNVTFNDGLETGITLWPGTWQVQAYMFVIGAAGTTGSVFEIGVGTAKGNSSTGMVTGVSLFVSTLSIPAAIRYTVMTPPLVYTIQSFQVYYAKGYVSFATSTATVLGGIQAFQLASI